MGSEIVQPTLADVTFIGANLRPEDHREMMCQVPAGLLGSQALAAMFDDVVMDWTWVAKVNGQPVAIFGFHPLTVPVWGVFALGTRLMTRAVPAITHWCMGLEQKLLDSGVRRVEARSIAGHDQAHRWLERLGCRRVCELPDHGRDGELFYLYAWHIGAGLPSRTATYRKRNHVHEDAEAAQDPEAPASGPAAVEARG